MRDGVIMRLDAVSHSYRVGGRRFENGKHTVLDNVSLQLQAGETLGLLGRNGSGKTTMLRLMAGILAPTRGRVTIAPGKTAALLTIGLGFRHNLSGRDNALLAAILQGCGREQAESYLHEIRDFAELGESFEEPVSTYSAGMRARLGFATALITHVDILLVDEVLSVGDIRFRKKAQAAMLERITGDQTVVFVSHMANQIEEVCDRAIWIDQGRIAAQGDVAEVLTAYQDS